MNLQRLDFLPYILLIPTELYIAIEQFTNNASFCSLNYVCHFLFTLQVAPTLRKKETLFAVFVRKEQVESIAMHCRNA